MGETFRPPSRFQNDTYDQIDNLMNECDSTVPNLIGKVREIRYTNNNIRECKGYKTKELVGKAQADQWKEQLDVNKKIIQVLNQNKLNEEVDDMLAQQKIQAQKEANHLVKSSLPDS